MLQLNSRAFLRGQQGGLQVGRRAGVAPVATSAPHLLHSRHDARVVAFKGKTGDKTWSELYSDTRHLVKRVASKAAKALTSTVEGVMKKPSFEEVYSPYDTPFIPIEGVAPPPKETRQALLDDTMQMLLIDVAQGFQRSCVEPIASVNVQVLLNGAVEGIHRTCVKPIASVRSVKAPALCLIQEESSVRRLLGENIQLVPGTVSQFVIMETVGDTRQPSRRKGIQYYVQGDYGIGLATVKPATDGMRPDVSVQNQTGLTIHLTGSAEGQTIGIHI